MINTLRLFALALFGALCTVGTTNAAWDNVFQVCCNDCGQSRASYSAPACPQACAPACAPQPEMRISYVQRCYYQPVTEYVQKSYYEPVKKNVTSYYYEPVTEYKYSTYYDPCTGCPQKVCTPTTAYKLRSQCNSVTSYVMRTCTVPVTSLKPVTYQQPVVSYYYPPTAGAAPAYIPPAAPAVDELRSNPPGVTPNRSDMIPPTEVPIPMSPGMSYPKPSGNVKLRPEKTVSRSSVVTVRGEVTMPDQLTPRVNAKLVFVNAEKPEQKEYVNANEYGEFDVRLAAGNWFMYLGGDNGKATYHKQISVGDRDTYDYKVVSR
ncbi:MAG: hypothetical protein K8U57_39740 [Planctomycetes bacterium]|nr:hypothetical protein [Planctomycetota bacterium]